jgi:hypothetical protein
VYAIYVISQGNTSVLYAIYVMSYGNTCNQYIEDYRLSNTSPTKARGITEVPQKSKLLLLH